VRGVRLDLFFTSGWEAGRRSFGARGVEYDCVKTRETSMTFVLWGWGWGLGREEGGLHLKGRNFGGRVSVCWKGIVMGATVI